LMNSSGRCDEGGRAPIAKNRKGPNYQEHAAQMATMRADVLNWLGGSKYNR
jgi:hypothetical protein